ncbi:response regulator [Sphingosinicella sp.]|uniref:response regulator n=1 Tax=Sphingosinicella sp. TaxID=1917971 RepID=UPI0040379911
MAAAIGAGGGGGVNGAARRGGWRDLSLLLLAVLASTALLLWAVGDRTFAAIFAAGLVGAGGLALVLDRFGRAAPVEAPMTAGVDVGLIRAALDAAGESEALAVSEADGRLLSANAAWARLCGTAPPAAVNDITATAAIAARRDGAAAFELLVSGDLWRGEARVVGSDGRLLWRLTRATEVDPVAEGQRLLAGETGRRLDEAGIMLALTDGDGRLHAATAGLAQRAAGESEPVEGANLVDFLWQSEDGAFRFAAEGKTGPPLRIVQIPTGEAPDSPSFFLMLDDMPGARVGEEGIAHVQALLDTLPLGLALADTDGRFVHLNAAFRKAAGLGAKETAIWPGDLVVDEDKAAVSDAVRRFGRGRALSGDLAVRMKLNPEEPVALTVAGARGLGPAAVLLSLKDNSEEARLKREIAQATKMQAVGQLAGGVAHDFNNILTAILGTCDLMLMRHTPGDSDYDDIQQIRSNSNRAANLTRQLLAFSRQQTLRPRVLQLPDVVAEVSHLLTRLIGERIKLDVKHGRGLGPIRADPGQLEQVIVNLGVNARDAMLGKEEGGTLTLQTYAVSAEDVRRMGTDVLPIAEYTAMKVTDTGAGIPPHIIGKIFEPFFTTKEVGKGTGLGLSTVYGIVKQSGGFIFAESKVRKGTTFTLYFPVHRAAPGEAAAKTRRKEKAGELWGNETVLLVEDEAMVRAVAERALTRHGYTVLSAENGEAGLEMLAREGKVDLLISDVVMPTMDGPTTARAARRTHPDLPILFISGYAEEQLRKSIDLPNVAFLAKPFSVQQLAETVREVLEK